VHDLPFAGVLPLFDPMRLHGVAGVAPVVGKRLSCEPPGPEFRLRRLTVFSSSNVPRRAILRRLLSTSMVPPRARLL
jgi:hypothetical protein